MKKKRKGVQVTAGEGIGRGIVITLSKDEKGKRR